MSDTLEKILTGEEDTPDIFSVVKHRDFFRYLQKGEPCVISYIVNNFDRILEIIFEEQHEQRVISPFLQILMCSNQEVKKTIISSTKFVNYILEYPRRIKIYHHSSVYLFFNSLSSFISENSELLPFFANRDFFESIIQNCDIKQAHNFMHAVLTSKSKSFTIFFNQIDIPSILARYIIGTGDLNMNVISLFESITDLYSRQCAASIVQNDLVTALIDTSFEKNCHQLMDFLDFLYTKSYQNQKESMWYTILFLVEDRIPEMCDFILKQNIFIPLSRSASNILLTYITERGQTFPKLIHVIEKFAVDFFKFPTNSFLHNTCFYLLSSIAHIPQKLNDVVKQTNLCTSIVNAYKQRETNADACYWGALREITELIKEPIGVPKAEWNNIVQQNAKIEKIIALPARMKRGMKSSQNNSSSKMHKITYTDIFAVIICLLAVVLLYLNSQ